jgi:hypothetical protein
MDIAEVLTLADELIFAKTGKHLDYVQEAICGELYKTQLTRKLLKKFTQVQVMSEMSDHNFGKYFLKN